MLLLLKQILKQTKNLLGNLRRNSSNHLFIIKQPVPHTKTYFYDSKIWPDLVIHLLHYQHQWKVYYFKSSFVLFGKHCLAYPEYLYQ